MIGTVLGFGISALSAVVVAVFGKAPSPEFFAALAGGLMALAGLVPAVIGIAIVGKPVTRLDGGDVLLEGWVRVAAWSYVALFMAALVPTLLSLGGRFGLESPVWAGIELGLVLLVTLLTPLLLFGVLHRLQSSTSTMLAVERAVVPRTAGALHARTCAMVRRAATQRSPERLRTAATALEERLTAWEQRRCEEAEAGRLELTRDLRDIAISEVENQERRSVKHRFIGLAAIAVLAADDDVACQALDELGLVVQHAVLDRDLALEGLARLVLVGQQIEHLADSASRDVRRGRLVRDCLDVWKEGLERKASARISRAAAAGISELLRDAPTTLSRALGDILAVLPGCPEEQRAEVLDELEVLTAQLPPFAELPDSEGELLETWMLYLEHRKLLAFETLGSRLVAEHARRKELTPFTKKQVVDALVHLALDNVQMPGLTLRPLRPLLSRWMTEGGPLPLLLLARRALDSKYASSDEMRGALIGEVVLALYDTPPKHWTRTANIIDNLSLQELTLAAPALTVAVRTLVDRLRLSEEGVARTDSPAPDEGVVLKHTAMLLMATTLTRTSMRSEAEDDALEKAALRIIERMATRAGICRLDPEAGELLRRGGPARAGRASCSGCATRAADPADPAPRPGRVRARLARCRGSVALRLL